MAKAKPRSLTYASPGIGTLPHLSGELLKSTAGIDIVHVPYKGTSAIMPAQISGEVMLSLVPLGAAMTQIRSGRLQPLAVTGRSRSAALLDVPTLAESGLPGFNVSLWYGLFAPGKTNQEVVKKINQQITNIFNLQEVKDRLLNLALEPSASTPGELAQLVRSEEKLWAKVIKEANIKID